MKFYGQLEQAALENLSADPSIINQGRIWFNTTDGIVRLSKDGTLKRQVLLNDSKILIGNHASADQNIRLHRAVGAKLQFVLGVDTTTEGSMATLLAETSSRLETYATGAYPAVGNSGRLIFDGNLNRVFADTGAAWISTGIPDDNAITTAKILDANVTTAKIADSNITTAKILDFNVTSNKIAANAITVAKLETQLVYNLTTVSKVTGNDEVMISDVHTVPGGNTRLNAKVTVNELVQAGTSARRRMSFLVNYGATTWTTVGFAAAPTFVGTAGNTIPGTDTTPQWYVTYTAAAAAGSMCGFITGFNLGTRAYLPELVGKVYTTNQSNERGFFGFTSASPDTMLASAQAAVTGSNAPAIAMAGFFYDAADPYVTGTGGWCAITSTGTAGQGTITVDCAPAFNNAQLLRVVFVSQTQVNFYANDVLVASHTTNIPNSTAVFGIAGRNRSAGGTAAISFGRVEMLHN